MQIISDAQMQTSRNYMQHGNISVFSHCVMVAYYSIKFSEFFHLKVDRKSLIRGALLHDYFLYDWHTVKIKEINGLHGFVHPVIAAENANKRFSLSKKEYDIISCHMWPLTITRIPKSLEGWLVSIADKYCSLLETFRIAPYSNENLDTFYSSPSNHPTCPN